MGWRNLGENSVYRTPWFELKLADVELPGSRRIDHYLLRLPPCVETAALDGRGRVLLLWRHRFVPDTWGWELPSGIVDPAEDLAAAAAREMLKESGWEPAQLRPLLRLEPYAGLTDSVKHIFWTDQAVHRGDPVADFESERIAWIPLAEVPALLAAGEIRSASTAAALLFLSAPPAGIGSGCLAGARPALRAARRHRPGLVRDHDELCCARRTRARRTAGWQVSRSATPL